MSSGVSTEAGPNPKPIPSIGVLIAISAISPLAMNIYLPSMAGMQEAFNATAGEIQLTMSFYLSAIAIAQLVLGPLSDQWGRRPVVVFGMGLFVIGSALCLIAPTVEALIGARILQAVGGCSGIVLARAIVRDVYGREQAASMLGYVTMGMTVAPTLGPFAGGLLDGPFGWQGGFAVMLAFGAMVWIATIGYLPETQSNRLPASPKQVFLAYRTLAREKLFWAYALAVALTSSIYFAYLGGVPFIAFELLGMSPQEMGVYFMIVALGYILGNFLSGKFAQRIGLYPMIVAGTVTAGACVGLLCLATLADYLTPVTLFMPMFLLGLGNGICLPSAISGAVSVRPDLAGSASGLTASLQVGFGAVTSALAAWLFSTTGLAATAWAMILVMAFGFATSMIAVIAIRALDRAGPEPV